MRSLVIILAIFISFLILRYLFRQSNLSPQKIIRSIVIFAALLVFLFLLVTGRLHWLFALVAALIPALMRLLPLLRYVPFLRNLYKAYQAKKQASGSFGSGDNAGNGSNSGQSSTVQSVYLKMILLHDSGEMQGEVLQGQYKGKSLKELELSQLMELMQECQHDNESAALLTAYLDRMHETWREQASGGDSHRQQSDFQDSGKMSKDEALDILGLQEGADEDDIVQAHRRLMQKLHPDHGGSTYLAAKINLAKDVLLK